MNQPPVNGTDPEVQAGRKRQVWLMLLVMLASGCAGVLIITGILWLFRNVLVPGS